MHSFFSLGQVPYRLEAAPDVGAAAKRPVKTEGHSSGNSRAAADDIRHLITADPQLAHCPGHAESQRLRTVVERRQSWTGGLFMRISASSQWQSTRSASMTRPPARPETTRQLPDRPTARTSRQPAPSVGGDHSRASPCPSASPPNRDRQGHARPSPARPGGTYRESPDRYRPRRPRWRKP